MTSRAGWSSQNASTVDAFLKCVMRLKDSFFEEMAMGPRKRLFLRKDLLISLSGIIPESRAWEMVMVASLLKDSMESLGFSPIVPRWSNSNTSRSNPFCECWPNRYFRISNWLESRKNGSAEANELIMRAQKAILFIELTSTYGVSERYGQSLKKKTNFIMSLKSQVYFTALGGLAAALTLTGCAITRSQLVLQQEGVEAEALVVSPALPGLIDRLTALGIEGVGLEHEEGSTLELLDRVFSDARVANRKIKQLYTGKSLAYEPHSQAVTVGGTQDAETIVGFIMKIPLR